MNDNNWLLLVAPLIGLAGYYLRKRLTALNKTPPIQETVQLIQAVITQRVCSNCGEESHEYGHFQAGARRSVFIHARTGKEFQIIVRRCKNCGNLQFYSRSTGKLDTQPLTKVDYT